ncbi:TPA: O-antigen ligase family protein [Vibrio cholerae]|nr:O-antigen ligase family protein [Vibrio cholerae]EGQ7706652.1 ligase [Vibrio cholerae]EIJ2221108.1 O-antigen ligase family protein [Vibrio cholerae]EKF9882180.1 O-antigen ligase family protein [Vibrio cholerae]ELD3371699.1 O-antigen ligase family protein [Vibrio cholerae]ELI0376671.1 O-antigen ligase family protein [Vibrio cholerae]
MSLSLIYFMPISLLFLSLGFSKAGINIGIASILLIFIYQLTRYSKLLKKSFGIIEKLSISLFLTGLIVSFLANLDIGETFNFLKKGIIFLLFPTIINLARNNVKLNVSLFYFGILAAICHSLSFWFDIGINNWNGERIGSFWDVGRWGEILAYSIIFTLPFLLNRDSSKLFKLLFILFISSSVICLILSGSRAPILAIIISSFILILFTRPKVLLFSFFSLCLLFFSLQKTDFGITAQNRLESITNTTSDASNISRITMWQSGLEFFKFKFNHQPEDIILGSGLLHFNDEFYKFMSKNYDIEEIKLKTMNNFSFSDSHNSYIDMLNKLGLFYLSLYISLLTSIILYLLKEAPTPWTQAGISLILTHLIMSFFYTSYLEYQTIVLFSLLALCLSKKKGMTDEH